MFTQKNLWQCSSVDIKSLEIRFAQRTTLFKRINSSCNECDNVLYTIENWSYWWLIRATYVVDGWLFGHFFWKVEGSSAHSRESRTAHLCRGQFTCGGYSHVEGTFTCGNFSHALGDIHVWDLLTCGGDIYMWELLTCGGDIYMWGLLTCGGGIHVWKLLTCGGGIHVWELLSHVEGTFTCLSCLRVEGTFP